MTNNSTIEKCISEEIINIGYSDVNFDKSLKLSSLLDFFQDIASVNAEKFGFGYSFLYPKNYIWVLLKYRIEFLEYPTENKILTLKTESRGCNKLFAYRNFELYKQNKIIARASSVWGILDFETKEMQNAQDILLKIKYMDKFIADKNDLKYSKIPSLTNIDYKDEFKVRYNDIDVNSHANNSNYIIWGLEPIPLEFRKCHKLKNIDIHFKKEIKYGEKLTSEVQIINCSTIHAIKNAQGENLCLIKCEWISS